jgi:hypothetical protein
VVRWCGHQKSLFAERCVRPGAYEDFFPIVPLVLARGTLCLFLPLFLHLFSGVGFQQTPHRGMRLGNVGASAKGIISQRNIAWQT